MWTVQEGFKTQARLPIVNEWASNVSTNIWGVCWFTSSLSMKELEEKFNLVLPPYIEVFRL